MRVLDVTNMRLVHRGADWPTGRGDPSSKGMVGHLVRNEKLVTWLQPTGKHHIRDQIPALCVGDRFCSLSVRMMKAIWRDVRLREGFVNIEQLPQGGFKPKIPEKLLQDKRRTQSRFKAMRSREAEKCKPSSSRDKRGVSITTRRTNGVLKGVILPLKQQLSTLPSTTNFTFTHHDVMWDILERTRRECPEALRDRESFIKDISRMYDTLHDSGVIDGVLETCVASSSSSSGPSKKNRKKKRQRIIL